MTSRRSETAGRSQRAVGRLSRLAFFAIGLAASLAFGVWSSPVSATAQSNGGGIELSPAKVTAHVTAGTFHYSITVVNRSNSPLVVHLVGAALSQDHSGAATFLVGQQPVPIDIASPDIDLAPGDRRQVPVTIRVTPTSPGVWEAVLGVFGTSPSGQQITTHTAIASIVEITGPGTARPAATLSSPRATATSRDGRLITIGASATDTGNVLIAPTASAVITSGTSVLATIPLGVPRIVPGATVGIQGAWTAPARVTGIVTVRIQLTNPTAEVSTTISYTGGIAEETAAQIHDLRAVAVRSGAQISLDVANIGNTAVDPTLRIAAYDDGRWHQPKTAVAVGALAPRRTRAVTCFVALHHGKYELAVRLYHGSTLLDQQQVYVEVEPPGGIGGSALVGIAEGVVLVVLVLILANQLRRRRSQRAAS